NAGMDDHLSKPYSRMQMRAMLERWLPEHDASEASAPHASGAAQRAPSADQALTRTASELG
ncbi:MAG: hypothetical protein ACXWUH_09595, partial [Burkholderiales bacterium]